VRDGLEDVSALVLLEQPSATSQAGTKPELVEKPKMPCALRSATSWNYPTKLSCKAATFLRQVIRVIAIPGPILRLSTSSRRNCPADTRADCQVK